MYPSADYEDLTSEALAIEIIFTDLLDDSVAVDYEEAADEAPVGVGVMCPWFVLKPMLCCHSILIFSNKNSNFTKKKLSHSNYCYL